MGRIGGVCGSEFGTEIRIRINGFKDFQNANSVLEILKIRLILVPFTYLSFKLGKL